MMITSSLQAVFGSLKREEMDDSLIQNQQFTIETQQLKEIFQTEQEQKKFEELRLKMLTARRYKSEEKVAVNVFNEKKKELEHFINDYLPVDNFDLIVDIAKKYRTKGYNTECPLNVLLFKTRSAVLDYNRIYGKMKKIEEMGNLSFRDWCKQDIDGNCAIINLHVAMAGIPTVVISPVIRGNVIDFTAAAWEAESGEQVMIRPLFSIPFDKSELKSDCGVSNIEDKMSVVSTIIAGCARDVYMLLNHGLKPSLPDFLENNPNIKNQILSYDYHEVRDYIIQEYSSCAKILNEKGCTEQSTDALLLASIAERASKAVSKLYLNA